MRLCRRERGVSHAFTLIELLVVVAIIGILAALLLPALTAARARARTMACANNLNELFMACEMYMGEYGGYYPLGAMDVETGWDLDGDFVDDTAGHWRWHGRRKGPEYPFDPRVGPLASYLGFERVTVSDQMSSKYPSDIEQLAGNLRKLDGIKLCPTFIGMIDRERGENFEWGSGGYGYNCFSVGSKEAYYGSHYNGSNSTACAAGWATWPVYTECGKHWCMSHKDHANQRMFRDHVNTVMFADAAYGKKDLTTGDTEYLESHELLQPRWMQAYASPPEYGKPQPNSWSPPAPTTHFRHNGRCNVLWLDGHVSSKAFGHSNPDDPYATGLSGTHLYEMEIGWFGDETFDLWDYR